MRCCCRQGHRRVVNRHPRRGVLRAWAQRWCRPQESRHSSGWVTGTTGGADSAGVTAADVGLIADGVVEVFVGALR